MTAAAGATLEVPAVTEAEALGDRAWFATHPQRRYRMRRGAAGWWIVRRRSGRVMLRAWAATLPTGLPDTDAALRPAWFSVAWAGLMPPERAELVREASRAEKLPGAAGA